jgi:hypothetical protein
VFFRCWFVVTYIIFNYGCTMDECKSEQLVLFVEVAVEEGSGRACMRHARARKKCTRIM